MSYYYITDKGTVGKSIWTNSKADNYRLSCNNVFKTFKEVIAIKKGIPK